MTSLLGTRTPTHRFSFHRLGIRHWPKFLTGLALSTVVATTVFGQSADELRQQLNAQWRAKDLPAAEVTARKITSLDKTTAQDWHRLALILKGQGKESEALAVWQDIIKRPDATSAHHAPICWYFLQRNKPQEALPACQNALTGKRDDYVGKVNMGHVYLLSGDKAQAMTWYRKSLADVKNDDDLKQGALSDFDLFLKNGWARENAQAAKQWFEQGWPTLKALRALNEQIAATNKADNNWASTLPVLSRAIQDCNALLGADDRRLAAEFATHYFEYSKQLALQKAQQGQGAQTPQELEAAWKFAGHLLLSLERWNAFEQLGNALVQANLTDQGIAALEMVVREKEAKAEGDAWWLPLTSMGNLAVTYSKLGQNDKALTLNEKVLATRTAKLGADHPNTLVSMGNLASTYGKQGHHDKALALEEKVLATRTAKLGADHPDTLGSMSNLAETYRAIGKHDKALALNEKTLAARTAKLGADHPQTLVSMNNLAVTYIQQGQHDKALALEEKVLAAHTAKLGADHPDTLTSMGNLAGTYSALGQHDKALALEEKVLAARTAKLGADHPHTLTSMSNLAATYSKLGQHDKALALEEKTLAARTAKLGADHPNTLVSMGNLWMTYMQLKKHAEATRLMERLVVAEVKRNGEKDGSTRTTMAHLYLLLDKQGLPKGFLASYAKDTQEDVLKRVFAMQQCPSKFQLGTMGLSTRPDGPGC